MTLTAKEEEWMHRAFISIHDRVERQQQERGLRDWVTSFNRMIRVANWRLNVEHRWPTDRVQS